MMRLTNIQTFGLITDHQEQAEKVVAKMKADRQKVVDAVKDVKQENKKKVYIEFAQAGLWEAVSLWMN